MAFILGDRVKESTTTTGTGTVNLAGAVSGFQSFLNGVGDGNYCYYCIQGGTEWETGIGLFTDAATDTLARSVVIESSNSNNLVSFSAGTKDVFCTLPADRAIGQWDELIQAYLDLGSTICAQTAGLSQGFTSTAETIADGRILFAAVPLKYDRPLVGAGFYQRTQGSYTADNNNKMGLYSCNAGTGLLTLVASSSNNGNLWKGTANTVVKQAFSGIYFATRGTYFVAGLHNQSAQVTAAQINRATSVNGGQATMDLPNSIKMHGLLNSQTDLPATVASSAITTSAEAYWFMLY